MASQMEKERNDIFVNQTQAMKAGTDELLAQVGEYAAVGE
ncbi:Restin-like protein [Vibrio cholerae]|nr:Restin-like protein [Vibrio cholerae]